MRPTEIDAAYAHCARLVRAHYENFPVASRLLPTRLRAPISVIYAFARGADDFADEGDAPPAERLAQLDDWGRMLDAAAAGNPPENPVFIALADVLARHALPVRLLHDLIDAFRMDVRQARWPTYDALMHYCRHSADPVGRLLLHLDGSATPDNLRDSDKICTALQLINHWQDLGQDAEENDRVYVPEDEMARYGVTVAQLRARQVDDGLRALMTFQRTRARAMLAAGAPLARRLRGRMALEIGLVVQGGTRILDKLDARADDPFVRPRLDARDWATLAWRTLRG
ncbi:MAG: squalene synthase HpnC [Gammaproteobacteria bacterium]